MRTTLLIITLTCGCFAAAHSQINQRHKKDTASSDLPAFRFKPSTGYTLAPPNDQKVNDPALTDDRLVRKGESENLSEERMPCYKPEGAFSMRIVKPDSAMTYTLLVKKF